MPMNSHLAPVEEDPDQSDLATNGVKRRTASQSSEADGPQGDIAESSERLEDVVPHPPLFWWAEPAPGHMFIAALMKVGVVYGFVWTINAIHSWLCTSAIGKLYRVWFNFCINVALLPLRSWCWILRSFNAAVKRFGSNKLKHVVFKVERAIVSTYLKIDKELAINIRAVIRKYPRLQETTTELIDDIFHHLICNQIHPGALPTGEMIRKAAERQAIPAS